MKMTVELGDAQVHALDELAQQSKSSRDDVIRLAVDRYLKDQLVPAVNDAFGLWVKQKIDGLDYQSRVRAEW